MAVRLSGLISGLDTDSLVQELVSAYSTKKDNLVKEQTKLSWTQDAWKSMNTKIYSFYSGQLSSMRFSKNYSLKTASVSNSSVAKVTASSSAVNGTQELKVKQLATSGYLTGGEIAAEDGTSLTGSSTLGSIADFQEGTIELSTGDGTTTIELTSDMTINQLVTNLKSAGVNASYDETNNRFFISATSSGEDEDFTLTGSDSDGIAALKALGIFSTSSAEMEKYAETMTAEELAALEGTETAASRIVGVDAEIELNGATFKNNTNTFQINGLTIQATAVTGDESVSVTVDTDVDGIYDMIKDFLSEYNELITAMDTAYNADSSSGYEPLTDDEKESMSDTEIEKWEAKIKDSLLRRDTTLGNLSSLLKTTMSSVYEVNGTSMSLATFGIKTASYFTAGDNEKGVYHIDGDSDDSSVSGSDDKLRSAIASDPDSVIEFFSQLSASLYNQLTQKMTSTSLSSAYTVYNDKQMSSQYSQYTSDIEDWEEKIEDYEDRYYSKFASMETALATLNSQSSALSGLFS